MARTSDNTSTRKKATTATTKKAAAKKTVNEVKKEDIDKVKKGTVSKKTTQTASKEKSVNDPKATQSKPAEKKPVKAVPKELSPEEILYLLTAHFSSIVNKVNSAGIKRFSSVTEMVDYAIGELEKAGKLNKQDHKSKDLRHLIDCSCFFLEDQTNAMKMAKEKY